MSDRVCEWNSVISELITDNEPPEWIIPSKLNWQNGGLSVVSDGGPGWDSTQPVFHAWWV